ncbi:MAG TPA: DUF4429 domain-containing protein [Bacillales bacterium]|nr:DUF4429 domain-containing protein [Bacillales bacterium]
MEPFEAKGFTGTVLVYPNKVVLKYKKLIGSGKGEKEIRLKNISGVQLKKPGIINGYIQFSFSGSSDQKGRSTLSAAKDENTIVVNSKKQYAEMVKAKELIEKYQDEMDSGSGHATLSQADELKKYAELKEQGILSEEEFAEKKKQILGL